MGSWRKAGVWLGLVEDDEERRYLDDELDTYDDYEEPARRRPGSSDRLDRVERADRSDRLDRDRLDRDRDRLDRDRSERFERVHERVGSRSPERVDRGAEVRSLGRVVPATHGDLALAPQVALRERAVIQDDEMAYRITTLHPTTYNEARTIGEQFRDGVPVIMNLTEMDESDAKRLVDFAAGLAFGLRGSIERVTNRVFLLSPANVEVTAEDKAKIAEGGFFNQS
jgi:cell division inhibitor SepF